MPLLFTESGRYGQVKYFPMQFRLPRGTFQR